LVENGPVRIALRVESDYGSSRLIQDFRLYSGSAQVDVHARLEWREARRMMKLRFPLNLNHMRSINEIPYGSIERFANGEEQPGQSWVDVSGLSKDNDRPFGFSLLNDGCYSFDVNIRDLGMTVLRSPIYAHHMPVEPQPGGDYTYMDQGWHEFNYSLLPHGSSWETAGTVRRAAELNQAAIVLPATLNPTGSLPNRSAYLWAEPENIQVTALKRAEEGDDLILRAFESSKAETQAILHLDFYGRVIEAQFSPNEIKTFRIPRDPVKPVIETGLLEWDQA
jgi:alpha-mannosidase